MGKIEGNHVAARYAAVQKEYQKQQRNNRHETNPNRPEYRAWQPEYRNDVSERHYEIASWLQEMGTLEETSTAANVPEASQTTGTEVVPENGQDSKETVPAKKQFSNQTHTVGAPNVTGTTADKAEKDGAVLTEEEAAKQKKAEEEKQKMPWESDDAMSKEETELERLQKLLEKYKERAEEKRATAKKPLRYKYSRVSTAIRSAKTVLQASNALVKANSSMSQLRRQAASGNYSESEIAMAQTHARKMVRTARTKLRNIKSEFNQENNHTLAKNHASEKMGTVIKKVRAEQKLEAIQQKDREMLKLEKLIQRKEITYKNKHRRKENWDLMEADMEYLRRRIEYLKNEGSEQTSVNNPTFGMDTDGTNVFTSGEQSVILEGAAGASFDPVAAVEAVVETAMQGGDTL